MDTNVLLKFEKGRQNGVVARHPETGKICLVEKASSVVIRPGEFWECRILFEKDRFCVVRPIRKVEWTDWEFDSMRMIIKRKNLVTGEIETRKVSIDDIDIPQVKEYFYKEFMKYRLENANFMDFVDCYLSLIRGEYVVITDTVVGIRGFERFHFLSIKDYKLLLQTRKHHIAGISEIVEVLVKPSSLYEQPYYVCRVYENMRIRDADDFEQILYDTIVPLLMYECGYNFPVDEVCVSVGDIYEEKKEEKAFICPFCGSKLEFYTYITEYEPVYGWSDIVREAEEGVRCPKCGDLTNVDKSIEHVKTVSDDIIKRIQIQDEIFATIKYRVKKTKLVSFHSGTIVTTVVESPVIVSLVLHKPMPLHCYSDISEDIILIDFPYPKFCDTKASVLRWLGYIRKIDMLNTK